jgi:predicted permease
MSPIGRLIGALQALLRSHRVERELDEELRAYLEASIEDKVRAGMARGDASRTARVEIGSLEAVKDRVRDVGWETRIENIWRDLRDAARTLRKSRAFTAAAVLTLALGIGANTAIFSAVNAIILRRLPVNHPDQLLSLAVAYPNGIEPVFSYAAYRRIAADGSRLIDAVAASAARRDAITLDGPPEPVDIKWVSGNYFSTLGVPAAIGRPVVPSDDPVPPGEAVAVVSDAYWARRLGRDPAAIGRSFRLRAKAFRIVGVAPRAFSGDSAGEAVDIWMPLSSQPGAPPWVWQGHSTTWLRILGRRRSGIELAQARAGLEPVYARVRDDIAAGTDSPEFRRSVLESRLMVSEASRGSSRLRDNFSTPLLVLMAIVALVLLVACANVANLMLARAAFRRRETAVCLAIGAGRWRLVRQRMAEALLLAGLGGVLGLLLAAWGTSMLKAMISGALPISLDISPDRRVLAFAMAVSCATAVVFGLLPALRATAIDPLAALKSAGGTPRAIGRIPLGRTLVVAQMVASVVLLVAAGLFVRSLRNLQDIELGFDPDRVLLVQVTPPGAEPPVASETRRNLYLQLLAKAKSVPGVTVASASFSGVFSTGTWGNAIAVEGFVPRAGVTARTLANAITPDYFDVMRIAILRGRRFTDGDHERAPRVAIVNETFGRRFLDGADVLGKRVALCSSDPCDPARSEMMEIVGVAENAKYADLREEQRPMLYVPFGQRQGNLGEIQVRIAGEPAAVAAAVHRELAAADSRVAIASMIEARDRVEASLTAERLIAKLSATFGLLALALAGVGLYGLTAYATSQRTGEIGVRMALGARRRDVRGLVLRDTLKLVALGAAIGIPIALGGARLISSQLYQVKASDSMVVSLSIVALSVATLLAGYLPARRAAAVDPASALRAE